MFDITDLNLRYRAHAERVEHDRRPVEPLSTGAHSRSGGARVIAAAYLLRASHWLAPDLTRRSEPREPVVVSSV